MLAVTGGAGFIGSNLCHSLARDGHDLLVVDDVEPSVRPEHPPLPSGCGFLAKHDFRRTLAEPGGLRGVDAVIHLGACSSTTETDEAFLRDNNLGYSVDVLEACTRERVPLVYASSAAVYGPSRSCAEVEANERPLNGYARSKAAFDTEVRRRTGARSSPVVGLRYFNVYGPGETHKGPMASLVRQWWGQLQEAGRLRLFAGEPGVPVAEQGRDFVHVDDAVAVTRWFLDHPERSGILNCGTGRRRTFTDLANLVIDGFGSGEIEVVPFPSSLVGHYQSSTRADLRRLREAGCDVAFRSLEDGVRSYTQWLAARWTPT